MESRGFASEGHGLYWAPFRPWYRIKPRPSFADMLPTLRRQIRPAAILRKNSQSNRSERGAVTQAVLMSVYHTLRLGGLNPTKTITNALKTYLTTGTLPLLPDSGIANG